MVGCGGCGGKEATAAVVKVRPKGARGSFTRQRSMVVMMNNTIGLVEVERRWCVLSADSSEIMKSPFARTETCCCILPDWESIKDKSHNQSARLALRNAFVLACPANEFCVSDLLQIHTETACGSMKKTREKRSWWMIDHHLWCVGWETTNGSHKCVFDMAGRRATRKLHQHSPQDTDHIKMKRLWYIAPKDNHDHYNTIYCIVLIHHQQGWFSTRHLINCWLQRVVKKELSCIPRILSIKDGSHFGSPRRPEGKHLLLSNLMEEYTQENTPRINGNQHILWNSYSIEKIVEWFSLHEWLVCSSSSCQGERRALLILRDDEWWYSCPEMEDVWLCVFSILFGNGFLFTKSPWKWRQNSKLTQNPRDPFRRLRSDTDPILESIRLEPNFFISSTVGDGVVCPEDFQKLAIPRSLGVGRHHAIKWRVLATPALQS